VRKKKYIYKGLRIYDGEEDITQEGMSILQSISSNIISCSAFVLIEGHADYTNSAIRSLKKSKKEG